MKGEYKFHDDFEIDDYINQADVSVPLVAMMCGVAGSGKTTFAQRLEKRGFVREHFA
ncbi:ATP-binding protein [Paenibacillus dokdonensis]|uniref:ATP-binding protein n=1 Tax=Paenibacillus dokdonensis TaxID=2567944 RepID=UPI001FE369D4|nr:ATP-binding protein [Paenibacillus dokdonensis]